MKKLILAVPTAMLLAAQAFAAPLQITLEGTVTALEEQHRQPLHVETHYRDIYGVDQIQNNYDYHSPQVQTISLDSYLGLQKGEKAVITLNFDPADVKHPLDQLTLRIGEGAEAVLRQSSGQVSTGALGLSTLRYIDPLQPFIAGQSPLETKLLFVDGALGATPSAMDIMLAAGAGKLKSAGAEITVLDRCYAASTYLVPCGRVAFSFDKVVFSSEGLTIAAVPEPATFALLGLGLIGVAAAQRRSGKAGPAIVTAR